MAVQSIAVASAASIAEALRPAMLDAGYELVKTGIAFTPTTPGYTTYSGSAEVHKSPGTLNAAGVDHYIVFMEHSFNGTRMCHVLACEGFDSATDLVYRYPPQVANVVPDPTDYSVGSTGAVIGAMPVGMTVLGGWSFTTAGGTVKIDIDINRLITSALYVGLGERTLPPSMENRVPLFGVNIGSVNINPSAAYGWTTREPGQAAASANNFRCMVSNNRTWAPTASIGPGNAANDAAEGYTSGWIVSPLYLFGGRFGYLGHRAILRDVLGINRNNALVGNDTVVVTKTDGTTPGYVANNVGVLIPSGLM